MAIREEDLRKGNKDIIRVNDYDLSVKEFNGQRIVTFEDIDRAHKRPKGTARRNFSTNKTHLIKNVDYFVFKGKEGREALMRANYTNFVKLNNSPNFAFYFITESGYLMLVKSFADDLAWKVQRTLVNTYFRHKVVPKNEFDIMRMYIDKLEELKYGIDEVKQVSDNALQKVEELEQKVDVTIKDEYVKANDIARELNLFSESGLPHSRIIGQIARILKFKTSYKRHYQDDYIVITSDTDTKGWEIYYKPAAVDKIINWWEKNKNDCYYEILYKKNCKNGKIGDIREKGYRVGNVAFKIAW